MQKQVRKITVMSSLHVVIGATGTLGSALVQHLHAEGAEVRALARNRELAESMLPEGVDIRPVDALDADSIRQGCTGAAYVYNCLYTPKQAPEVVEHLIAAARDARARLIYPSNPDVYGPPLIHPIPETHPHDATSSRGKRRIAIEETLMAAHQRGDAEVVIGRLASLYGAHLRGSLMAAVFDNARLGKKSFWLGSLDVVHDMLYAPDAAAALALLAHQRDAAGQSWHISGPEALTGRQFLTLIYNAFGRQPNIDTRTRTFVKVLSFVTPDAKKLLEVMYQFDQPFSMSSAKLLTAFPEFHFTPHEDAAKDTAEWFLAEHGTAPTSQTI
jgi:nucleoside-diphosphate-sugar epimerase